MGTRAAIYVRLSRDREDQTSTERQERDARAMAKARGFTVAKTAVYGDVGLSGFKRGVVRPGFDRMLEDVGAGLYDVVLVWKLDRVTRQGLRALGRLLDVLDEGGAYLVSVTEGIDTSTGMGEMIAGILAGIARQESENIAIRTRSGKDYSRQQGRPNGGGRRPMGYTTVTFDEIVPEERALLHEARDRVLAGQSLHGLCREWNGRGIRTPSGGLFSAGNFGRMLRSPHLAGLRAPGLPGNWPPIFTTEEHEQLCRKSPSRPAFSSQYLLTGLLVCSLCGRGLHIKGMARGRPRRYSCTKPTGCGCVSVLQLDTDEFVTQVVVEALDTPALRRLVEGQDTAAEEKRLALAVEADKAALEQASRDHYIDRVITREEFFTARAGLEDRIGEAESRLRRLRAVDRPAGSLDVREGLTGGTLEERRAILRLVVEEITVNPAPHRGRNKFSGERFAIRWRV